MQECARNVEKCIQDVCVPAIKFNKVEVVDTLSGLAYRIDKCLSRILL